MDLGPRNPLLSRSARGGSWPQISKAFLAASRKAPLMLVSSACNLTRTFGFSRPMSTCFAGGLSFSEPDWC